MMEKYRVTKEDVDRHVLHHLGPLSVEIMKEVFDSPMLPPAELVEVDGKEHLLIGDELIVEKAGVERIYDDPRAKRQNWNVMARAGEYIDTDDVSDDDNDIPLLEAPVRDTVPVRRAYSEYDTGEGHQRPLRRWTEERMEREIEKTTRETVTFLDEMLNVRDMAHRVYREIMDNGDLKYYATAVSAIHEVRGVMESLAKLSLIAQRIDDGNERSIRKLSPAMRDMIRSMGITEPVDPDTKVSFMPVGGMVESVRPEPVVSEPAIEPTPEPIVEKEPTLYDMVMEKVDEDIDTDTNPDASSITLVQEQVW
jgi:hypothetical protein